MDLPIYTRLVQQIIKVCPNLKYLKINRDPFIKKEHIKSKLELAHRSIWKETNLWIKVFFSNKKKFNLDGPERFACHWNDIRKKPELFPTRQNGRGGFVMKWAAISFCGISDITFATVN